MSKEKELGIGLLTGLAELPIYPLNFIKVLMQINHEPMQPFQSKTIFGRNQLFYPNSFSYIKYVYSFEGISGLYRGIGMKILSTSIGNIVYTKTSKLYDDREEQLNAEVKPIENDNSFYYFRKKTSKEITIRCWAVCFSHPFHVMALRCMAQFVGGETSYSSWNVFQNALEIYRGEGISGFFSGLIPRLIFEASSIAIANGLAYILSTYVFEDKELEKFIDMFSSFFCEFDYLSDVGGFNS